MEKSLPRKWDWMSAILIFFMSQIASWRLVITEWTDYLLFAQSLAIMGTFLGLALGISRFKRKAVLWLILGYSLTLIPWQMSFAIDEDVTFSERLISVGGRLLFSLDQFFRREAVEDGILFVAFISIVAWIIGLLSGFWWSRYHNYLVATLPNGVFIVIIHHYDQYLNKRLWFLGAYIMFAMLLLGRSYYLKNHERWRNQRVFQTQENAFDLMVGVVATAFLFIIITWTIPVSAAGWESASQTWHRFTRPWRDMQEWFSNAVEPLSGSQAPKNVDSFYGNSLSLGSGTSQSDTVLFTVTPPKSYQEYPYLYWRGYVYNNYKNGIWSTTFVKSQDYSSEEDSFTIPSMESRTNFQFTVNILISHSLLYTASQPIWVSRPGEIIKSIEQSGVNDIVAWKADPALKAGETYFFRSAIAEPFIQDLQEAGTEYPEWILDRYLQLPEDFSPRIIKLAEDLTQDQTTPYGKATTITNYLRQEIEYANPIPEIPNDVDPLEFILFESKQGFCNYYATLEVLMLRSLGIPARMAVGFSSGEIDEDQGMYIVRGINTHAWPEVYFPDIGWIEFEPTANQEPLVRLNRTDSESILNPRAPDNSLPLDEENPDRVNPNEGLIEEGPDIYTGPDKFTLYALYLGIFLLVTVFIIFVNSRYAFIESLPIRLQSMYVRNGRHAPSWINYWVSWNSLTSIQRSFEAINQSLRLLGDAPAISLTPDERASKLEKILPQAAQHIHVLSHEHQSSLFTQVEGDTRNAKRASLMIRLYTLQAKIRNL